MHTLTKAALAGAATVALLGLGAPSASAGGPDFVTFTVTGSARCLPTGEAEITWDGIVEAPTPVTVTSLELEIPTAEAHIGFHFSGTQSGAATGPVSFEPNDFVRVAGPDAFPALTSAVAVASGTTGGTVDLDALAHLYNPEGTEFFDLPATASVDLPICEQPIGTTAAPPSSATAALTATPRFTG
jgi:hypothetical protein